jgi:chorismate mutase
MEAEKEVTREDAVAWYKDQIELATLRADLAEQQARALRFESERLQHVVMIANIKSAGNEIMKNEEDEEETNTNS